MSKQVLGLIELLLVFGLAIGFGLYQLRALKRQRLEEERRRRQAGKSPDSTSETDN